MIRLKKEADFVLVNEKPAFLTTRLKKGDLLTLHIMESVSSEKILPVELPLSILYEDEDLMVIDKPAGMPIHPSMNNYDNSVANALAWYFHQQGNPFVFRCINRLDRDTSGLTIIAKHFVSAGILSGMTGAGESRFCSTAEENKSDDAGLRNQFRTAAQEEWADLPNRKQLQRQYLAIARGTVIPPSGTITAPLGRKPGSVIERVVDFEKGESAVTHYRVITEKNGYSLVSLFLETGRTHQIRIYMKYLGYPLIGDYLYNPDMEVIGRQALHSYRLSFPHPITGESMIFTSPLPEDMHRILL
ncbi:MAG: RluA family pseudouridine synthase [Roseburia sp.]|nr:RluA family pseudouridine synthase [Roseburia sp.]MCM1096596.1 RluA family pseudouridine synthase [Ruminococcus flavefaciens]